MWGMAPEAEIYSYRVCEPNRECWGAYVAAGIYAAIADSMNIINMSLDGPGHDAAIQAAIDSALAHNILVVGAAGNSPPFSYIGWPASYPEVMSVGAIAESREPWAYSAPGFNDGDYVRESREIEAAAPGAAVLAALKSGCWVLGSGTSLAAPMVTGLAAKLWNGDAAATRARIDRAARFRDLHVAGDDTLTGFGLPTIRDFSGVFVINAAAGLGGSISPSGAVQATPGATQTFTIARADSCFAIKEVKVDGVSQGPIASYTFTNVTADHVIQATFASRVSFTITASAGPGGAISPIGVSSAACGSAWRYTISGLLGCGQIQDVKVDGVSQGPISSYTFANMRVNHAIAATFTAVGTATYTITAAAGTGGTISPAGASNVTCGSSRSYTVAPSSSCYTIQDVKVDGVSQGSISSYTFTSVSSDHVIIASFTPAVGQYTITASAGAGGTISPSGTRTVECGTTQSYTITPNACARIQDVKVDGVSQGPTSTYRFSNVSASHTISATFSATQTYTITASAGTGGTITPSGVTSVACGDSRSYTIARSGSCPAYDVKVDGVSQGPITSYTFTNVTASHTISATFATGPFSITATAGAGGTISPGGVASVTCGGSQSYTIAPSGACPVSNVKVDGVSQGPITSYTFNNVTVSHTISATFATGPFSITATAGGGGTISPIGVPSVACGASQSYTIAPSGSCSAYDVKVDGVSQGPITSYTFTNVLAGHTISVTFTPGPFSITASAGAGGTISPSGATSVVCGGSQSYTITRSGGCPGAFDVKVDGVSQGPITSYTFTNVLANHTISATSPGGPFTINATVGFGGWISPQGLSSVGCGGNLTYLIFTNHCFKILDVKVDGVSRGPVSNFQFSNVTANHTILATFSAAGPFAIDVDAGSGGTISPGSGTVTCGTNRTYTIASADNCHPIQDVKVDGMSRGPISSYQFADVRADHTIEATFSSLGPYSIDASAGAGGTVSPGGTVSVACGETRTYTIAPSDGCHRIQDVRVDGFSRSAITSYTFFSVRGRHTIEADFSELGPFTIDASAGPGGAISPEGASGAACGGSLSCTIAPSDSCHVILDVKVDGVSQGPVSSYNFNGVTADHAIEAAFSALGPYAITASADPGSTISPGGATSVACGGSLSYAIAPSDPCRVIGDVQVDGVSVGAVSSYTFPDVRGNHTIASTAAPAMTLSETHESPSWASDGMVDLTVTGGTPPYTFDWSNGATSEDLASLAGGTYEVRVTDGLGCAQDLAVTIASDNPTALALGKPTPNPTSGPLRLRYAVPAQAAVRLSVLDLQGREVAVLAEGTQPAGWSWANWNGETGSGRAPGGVYFFRLQSGGRQIVQRFALIR
jgi:ferredoxin-NADP reductase